MATAVGVGATGNAEIDGLLSGAKWSGSITFSFPDSPSDYPSSGYSQLNEPAQAGFASAPAAMQAAINYAVALIQGYTNIQISYAGTGSADLQIAQSSAANPTSHAYYPGNYSAGGDIWFGTGYNYSGAKLGNYLFATALHELGHALGLKHSQETGGPGNVAVPYAHDNSEYSIMSYRSYAGAPLTGYTAETYGFSQTYMANDILALQTMYGANYNTQSGNTVYTWSSTTGQMSINGVAQLAPGGGAGGSANRVFETIWDGNGVDTYDLSNYTTAVSINLNPGASSITSTTQLAYLGNGHYAAGNIYNAYLFNGDLRSLIDNAVGGSAGDTLVGNVIANSLNGGGGNDTLTGNGGNDAIIGGLGTDTAVYSGNKANYTITYNSATQTFTLVDTRGGTPDGTDTVTGVENFQFADGTYTAASLISASTVIESSGTTSLVKIGDYFYFYDSGGSGPSLPIAASAMGIWTPIGVEKTSTGYQLAWKNVSNSQYAIWNTDNNGNYTGAPFSGSGAAVATYETSFNQDLNGDGIIGSTSTVVEANGSTSLVKIGDYFYFYNSGGSGPSLPIAASAMGSWTPIGVEQTSTGYQLAWKNVSNNQYAIWNTDSNGNYVGAPFSGSGAAVTTYEASFNQDLNGDGIVGGATVIEANGSTSLVKIGDYFYFYNSSGSGPSLPIAASAMGTWTPIGVEQTSTGYQLAWRNGNSNQYAIWATDSNGNYVGALFSGSGAAIAAYESSFQQDLNGNGSVGQAPLAQASLAAGDAQHADGFLQHSGHSDFLADLAWTASYEVGVNRDMNGNGFVGQAPLAPSASPAEAPDPFPLWNPSDPIQADNFANYLAFGFASDSGTPTNALQGGFDSSKFAPSPNGLPAHGPDPFPLWRPSDTAATDIFAGQQAFAFGSDSGTPTNAPQVTISGLGDGNLAPPTQTGEGNGSLPDSDSTFASVPTSFDGWLNDVHSLSNLVFRLEMGPEIDSAVVQFLGIAGGNFAPSPGINASAGDASAPMPDSADVMLPTYGDMHPHLILV